MTKPGDEVVLATAHGMAIRFTRVRRPAHGPQHQRREGHQARRATTSVVGMVVADPEATLLTACANGYGKRTPFGPNLDGRAGAGRRPAAKRRRTIADDVPTTSRPTTRPSRRTRTRARTARAIPRSARYRTQRRGGKGLRDIKTTPRNGPVIGIVRVDDDDELLMMTARGKIQRIRVGRHQHHRPQHAGRADHEPRRRRHAGRRQTRSAGGERRQEGRGVSIAAAPFLSVAISDDQCSD